MFDAHIFLSLCFTLYLVDLLSRRETRLEKLFYRLFQQTRIHPDREFFRPYDALGRPMLPLYVTVLRMVSSADTELMRRFYRTHKNPVQMQDWIEQQLIQFTHRPQREYVASEDLKSDSESEDGAYNNSRTSSNKYSAKAAPPQSIPRPASASYSTYGSSVPYPPYSTMITVSAASTPTTQQSSSPHDSGTYAALPSADANYPYNQGAVSQFSTQNVYSTQGTYAAPPVSSRSRTTSGSGTGSFKSSSKAGVSQPSLPVPYFLPPDGITRSKSGEYADETDMV